jgi:tetratricopeptide (TPR) repeat protein
MCTAVNFKEDLHYFWRIGVSDQHKQILWSSTRYFTKTESQPAIPNLIAPVNNQNFSHQEVTFQWQKVPFAKTYHVQIASDSTFRHIEIDSSGNRDTSISLKRFKAATTYYWRVKTEKRTITGDWSKPFSFTIHTAVDSGNFPDYVIEAVFALKNKNCTEAELAINKLQSSDPRKDTLVMRLIEKYLAEGNKTKAMRCFKSITSVDMFSELLKGRLLIDDKNYTDAFEVLDAALHLKTRFKKSLVSADVTYYRAIAANNNYNSYKSEKWKQTALEAWHQVYTIYKDNHNHPRYIEASRESSRIAE